LLIDAIPDAELEMRTNSGHLYYTDDARIDERIQRFLLRHTPELTGPAVTIARLRSRLERRASATRRALASRRRALTSNV
jgi:hypothetical protein